MNNNLKTSNILVVDDKPENLQLIEQMLNSRNYQVRLFTDGFSAFDSAEYDPPDLILLDVMMPEIDGYEVCKKIKANKQLKEIPVIFISAKDETFDKVKAFKAGGVDYITKPFQVEEVLARVETHLKMRQYQLELTEKNISLQDTLDSLKAVQSRLIQSEKMASLGTLTAGIAHEINNPINAINSSSIGLKRLLDKLLKLLNLYNDISYENFTEKIEKIINYKNEIDFKDLLIGMELLMGNIEKGTRRTTDIIKSLKTFTYNDLSEKKTINIHENLDTTLSLLNHRVENKIKIVKEYGDVPPFLCFPGKMNQVFMNLLVNSIDAINAKGEPKPDDEIIVKTSLVNKSACDFIEIVISDTGIGISDSIQNRVFEPFFTTKEIGKGTGLGLSISHGIIRNHSGTIEIESKPNIGTTFTILLPLETTN